jgi:uncharacterized protein (DUF1501 family)
MQAAGRFLAAPGGPSVAVTELDGWDTHAGQGVAHGRLARQLALLDQGVDALRAQLGGAWAHTAVLAVSEFGRTAAPNGTGGTDHGTAGAAFVLGGAVRGGRVLADWPGLATRALHEGRDLAPTLDVRAVAKGLLHDHMRVARAALDTQVFPGSAGLRPLPDLIRG